FSYHSYAPTHVHSFPTRRSSDLLQGRRHFLGHQDQRELGRPDRLEDRVALLQLQIVEIDLEAAGQRGDIDDARGRGRLERLHERSEEHTSELQSQSNLVCRLLLE